MADKDKRTGLAPPVADTGSHGVERVVIKSFDFAKGSGILNRDDGPDVAFALRKALLPTLGEIIDGWGTGVPLLVRFTPDGKYVTEIRGIAGDRAEDLEPKLRVVFDPMLKKAFYSGPMHLAVEMLNKPSKSQPVVKSPQSHEPIAKKPAPDNIVPIPGKPERKDEGRLNEPLLRYLKAKNVPPAMWSDTAAEIERLIGKKLAAAVARPLWDDRAKYPKLANLSAPLFLKRVWADQIGADGTIEKEFIRQNDRSLMGTVDNYITTRERRRQDAGDAEGLRFITRKTRPKMTRKTRVKAARPG